MSRGRQHDDDLTDADRAAIAAIRRELDAEFGPLEPAEPLAAEPWREPPRPASAPRAAPAASPRAAPPPRSAPSPRPRPRSGVRVVPLFLLGALVGGAVGGVTGGLTTLLWLQYGDGLARVPAASLAGGAVGSEARRNPQPPRAPRPHAAVESALDEWVDATKAGDIERQMRFYPARVPVYYTWRDASREAVRAEKLRVFGDATRLDIVVDPPDIELADAGDRAVTRFRKRYVIEGPSVRRRGEVVQELRWARTGDGWVIVAERDAEVLAPSASVGQGTRKRGGTIEPAR